MDKKKILVVVDMQNDFISGVLGTPEAQAIVPKVRDKIIEAFKTKKQTVFYTVDVHDNENYLSCREGKHLPIKHCINGTKGMTFPPEIAHIEIPVHSMRTINGNSVIDLGAYRNFGNPIIEKDNFAFEGWLHFISEFFDLDDTILEFEVCGLTSDICVVSNAFALRQAFPEAEITIDASCCAGTTPEAHKAALMTMKSCQMNIINEDV